MDREEHVRLSKLLSWALRHAPSHAGIVLDDGGWTEVDRLLDALAERGESLDRAGLEEIIATSDKQRFSLSDDGDRIRANQRHSVPVDLGLEPVAPPDRLFHGTVSRFLERIREQGLRPRQRHHVHLSETRDAAIEVGRAVESPSS